MLCCCFSQWDARKTKAGKRSLCRASDDGDLTALDPIMNDYHEASTVNLFVVTDRAKEAIHDFYAGKLTPEEAAEILYQELVYTLKG